MASVQYPANNPCEDRFDVVQLKELGGYFCAVFDGHGGHILADIANKKMHLYFEDHYKSLISSKLKEEEKIKESINIAYEKIVSSLLRKKNFMKRRFQGIEQGRAYSQM